jgi:hypothetical protein
LGRVLEVAAFITGSMVLSGGLMLLVYNFDRVLVLLLRPLHPRLFPLAHRVARSLREEPDQWDYDRDRGRATHRPSGLVVVAGWGDASAVRFTTKVGEWKPSWVERRILRNALDRIARLEVRELSASYMEPEARRDLPLLAHEPGHVIKGCFVESLGLPS